MRLKLSLRQTRYYRVQLTEKKLLTHQGGGAYDTTRKGEAFLEANSVRDSPLTEWLGPRGVRAQVASEPASTFSLSSLPLDEDFEVIERTNTEMRAWAREMHVALRDLKRMEEVFRGMGLVRILRKRVDGRRRKVWRFLPRFVGLVWFERLGKLSDTPGRA